MHSVEQCARDRRARRLELEVFSRNEAALCLYRILGFVEEGRRRQSVENVDGLDDIVFMAKMLV